MSFHSKQMRVPLTLQIILKNIEIIYQPELKFLGIYEYITENLESGAHAQSLKLCKAAYMTKTLKGNNKPLYDKKHLLFKFSVMSAVWYYIMGWGY
jgi:hypothetical protein